MNLTFTNSKYKLNLIYPIFLHFIFQSLPSRRAMSASWLAQRLTCDTGSGFQWSPRSQLSDCEVFVCNCLLCSCCVLTELLLSTQLRLVPSLPECGSVSVCVCVCLCESVSSSSVSVGVPPVRGGIMNSLVTKLDHMWISFTFRQPRLPAPPAPKVNIVPVLRCKQGAVRLITRCLWNHCAVTHC